MREVFVHQDSARVGHYKSILDSEGIPNFIRNGISGSWLTNLPSPVFFPVLCVTNDEDYERAIEVLRKIHKPEQTNAPDWKCPQCGEEVPGTFDSCWKCEGVLGAREVVAGSPQQATPMPVPAAGDARRVMNVFRWLLIFQTAVFLIFWFMPGLGVIHVPSEVRLFLSSLEVGGGMQTLGVFVALFTIPLALVANLLCFLPVRIGRSTFIVSLLVYHMNFWTMSYSITERWTWVLWEAITICDGVILALMFTGPLAPHFRKDTQRATP